MDHLSVHVIPEQLGGHTHVRVFAGKDADHREMCGSLVFRNEEWELLADHLAIVPGGPDETVELIVDPVTIP
jgi:hypothetical protein